VVLVGSPDHPVPLPSSFRNFGLQLTRNRVLARSRYAGTACRNPGGRYKPTNLESFAPQKRRNAARKGPVGRQCGRMHDALDGFISPPTAPILSKSLIF
jgi:hypothetical protein